MRIRMVVFTVCLLVSLGVGAAAEKIVGRPNILFITTDQQFADVMSCAGSKWVKTPAMDSIAARGVRFTNAYVNYPVCRPERYTMYTGRLPCTRRLADKNEKPVISLGNQARAGGYVTAYFGKWHIQGETFRKKDSKYNGFDFCTGGRDEGMTDSAIEWLSKKDRKEPFLAVVSYYNPHDICEWGRKKAGFKEKIEMHNGDVDIDPPLEKCPPLPENFAVNFDEAEAMRKRRQLSEKGVPNAQMMAMNFSKDEWRQYRWAYNRLVEMVDLQVGRLLEALEKEGLAENTVIIFTSDHGDGYGAHQWHQKSALYDESCRVPFIVSVPGGGRKGEAEDRLVSVGIDVMPTISEVVGVAMPEGPYYGKSAMPLVYAEADAPATHEYVVTEAEVRVGKKGGYDGRAVRSPQFKYHVWNKGEQREQLFDMLKDPGETSNLAGKAEFASEMQKHRAYLADWLKRTDDRFEAN